MRPRCLTPTATSLVSLSVPLFAVEALRPALGGAGLTLPLPVVLSIGVAMLASVTALSRGRVAELGSWHTSHRLLLAVLGGLLFATGLQAIRASIPSDGLRAFAKLLIGAGVMLGSWWVLRRPAVDLSRQATLLLVASVLLLGYVVYVYAVEFRVPYLGNNLDEPTRFGRNQISLYLVFVLPLAIARLFHARGRTLSLVLVAGLVIPWIYAGSRGAWFCVILAYGYLALATVKPGVIAGSFHFAKRAFLALAPAAMALLALRLTIGAQPLEFAARLVALVQPSSAPESTSVDIRKHLIAGAVERWSEAPWIGVGLTNSRSESGLMTHNEYLAVLSEQGVLGLLVLATFVLVVLFCSGVFERSRSDGDWTVVGARSGLVGLFSYLTFINALSNPFVWFALGFTLASTERARFRAPRTDLSAGYFG